MQLAFETLTDSVIGPAPSRCTLLTRWCLRYERLKANWCQPDSGTGRCYLCGGVLGGIS